MAELKLCLLGPPQIELDRRRVQLGRRKAVALLAYLTLSQQSHTRDGLATLLWPELDQTRARSALRRTLWALQKGVGEGWLETERHSLGLRPAAGVWLDVAQFEGLTVPCPAGDHPSAEACLTCAGRLSQAVALYRGDFMAGFSLRDSPGFDEWQAFQAERLQSKVTSALERLVDYHGARREYERAIAHAQRWLALDPLREAAHCRLMELYAWAGRRADARRQYKECQQILAEELGLPPQEETHQLAQAIREGREPAPPPRPLPAHRHNLPQQPTPFVGREEELAEIDRLLGDPACRLLTLLGPGGVGKTRLALEAAAGKVEAFSHGVRFVPLAPLSSANHIVPAIADALRFSFQSKGKPKDQLLDFVRGKEMLLVLDNFEHLLEGTALLTEILSVAPGLSLLITSRQRLNLSNEHLLDVRGLRCPQNGGDDGVENYSALQLFYQTARRVNLRFSFPRERQCVARICRSVEGMPLAIELASAQVRERPCAQIAQQIEHNLNLLATTLRDVPARHRSLRAAFEHSWDLLSVAERETFARLSVFRGGFQAEAARQVTGASPGLLDSLVGKSLLQRSPSGRYEMLEVLRQCGIEKLAQEPQETVRDRHCGHYVALLRQQGSKLQGADPKRALEAIQQEIENVRQAWAWAVEQAQEKRIERSFSSLFTFYDIKSWFQEGERVFARAAQAFKCLDTKSPLTCKLLARQAWFLFLLDRYPEAQNKLQDGLEVARASNDLEEMIFCLLGLAKIDYSQGDNTIAKELAQQALTLSQTASLRSYEAWALGELGSVCWRLGDFVQAETCLERALTLQHQLSSLRGEAKVLIRLGMVSVYQGNYDRAIACFEKALTIFSQMGDPSAKATALNNLGNILAEQGDYAQARACFEQSLEIRREIGARGYVSVSLQSLGDIAGEQGEYTQACACYEQALQLFEEIGDRWSEGQVLNNLGLVFTYLGDYARAKFYCEQALTIRREIDDKRGEGVTLANIGLILYCMGDHSLSQEHSQQALRLARDLGERPLESYALTHLGHALSNLARLEKARHAYQQALAIRRELGQPNMATELLAGLARLCLAQNQPGQARAYVQEILEHLETDTLAGTRQPFNVYLTCYHTLLANRDPRAGHVLAVAHRLLQERAAKIDDQAMRRSFLENVAAHREIVAESVGRHSANG